MTLQPEEAVVRRLSSCTVKPTRVLEKSDHQSYLTPWDLDRLSGHYGQSGLLFPKPLPFSEINPTNIIDQLKNSLSLTLDYFFPFSGRLATRKQDNPHFYSVFLDCSNPPGAEFVHAVAEDVTLSDILSPIDVPPIVKSFFLLDGAVNHDGHTLPLLSVQVTELVDGIFIGCSYNHAIADGTTYFNFLNTWAEICRSKGYNINCISRPLITKRWFLEEHLQGHAINLPFSHPNDFIQRHEIPLLRERIFHFSAESIAQLKAKSNEDCSCTDMISSLQALSALVWRSVTRAQCPNVDQETTFRLVFNDRSRLNPPLSRNYFGSSIHSVSKRVKVGELLNHNLGWAAWLLREAVGSRTDRNVRDWLKEWVKNPSFYHIGRFFDRCIVTMAASPRFNVYECEFGWGKPMAVLGGRGDKFNGKVYSFPGREGGGSIDLDVCLSPETMCALESDEEFIVALRSGKQVQNTTNFQGEAHTNQTIGISPPRSKI